jgi:hypothetical protein
MAYGLGDGQHSQCTRAICHLNHLPHLDLDADMKTGYGYGVGPVPEGRRVD